MDNIDPTLDRLEHEIAARLKPVCTEMTPEEFNELVRDIAKVKLKYEPESGAGE
jgi:hypothetical protein